MSSDVGSPRRVPEHSRTRLLFNAALLSALAALLIVRMGLEVIPETFPPGQFVMALVQLNCAMAFATFAATYYRRGERLRGAGMALAAAFVLGAAVLRMAEYW